MASEDSPSAHEQEPSADEAALLEDLETALSQDASEAGEAVADETSFFDELELDGPEDPETPRDDKLDDFIRGLG